MTYKGFTLIEILIVTTILWILWVSIAPKISSMKERALDTQRISNIRELWVGLTMYYLDNHMYPLHEPNPDAANREVSTDTNWLHNLWWYLKQIPIDPKNTFGGNPWIMWAERIAKMYAYYNYTGSNLNSIYDCKFSNYAIIWVTQLESAVAYPFAKCPWYDWGTVLDYGYMLYNGEIYKEYDEQIKQNQNYTIIINSGNQDTWSITPPPVTLSDCQPNANGWTIWTTESCNCSASDTQAGGNIRWVGEYRANSKLCKAAVHAWAIGIWWWKVSYIITPWRTKYAGWVANGTDSKPYSKWGKSIKFILP